MVVEFTSIDSKRGIQAVVINLTTLVPSDLEDVLFVVVSVDKGSLTPST
jgi:pyruvate/2-oxoglutarate/acetoin dehydrogenase E1 component